MLRFRDVGETIYSFGDEFLIRCPRCQRRASVIPWGESRSTLFGAHRAVCAHCGYVRDWKSDHITVGGPADWYFHYPLWLETPCCGQTLWAYNEKHLTFLENYVVANLRERLPNRNKSLASRLPGWMQDAKNREEVLKGIARLRNKLQ